MTNVRWGLVSTAHINRRVIPAIRMSARGELAAVASRSQASAAAYAKKWDIPLVFGSYEAMLASDSVDAVTRAVKVEAFISCSAIRTSARFMASSSTLDGA